MEADTVFRGMVRTMSRAAIPLALLITLAAPASAQVDLSGTWSVRMHEDWMERWPGPDPGDFTGMPLNEDGRAWAQSYSPSQLSMPERQCLYYPQTYRVVGPFAPRIWPESAPGAGIIAWRMSGAVDMSPRAIWMDGRPHPRRDDDPHEGGAAAP